MIRLTRIALLLICAALVCTLPAASEEDKPPQEREAAVRTDRVGDPLPPGAIQRLGTTRLRHFEMIKGLAFSPDQKTLYSVGSRDRFARVWDVATGRQLQAFALTLPPDSLALSPDGKTLAVATVGMIRLLNPATGQPIGRSFGQPKRFVRSMSFSPDSKRLAEATHKGGPLRVWNLDSTSMLHEWVLKDFKGSSYAVVFSLDGNTVAACGNLRGQANNFVVAWDVKEGKKLFGVEGPPGAYSLQFTPDGKQLVCGGLKEDVWAFDARTGARKEVAKLQGMHIALIDGNRLLTTSRSDRGELRLWNVATGELLYTFHGQGSPIEYLTASADGSLAASGGDDGSICIWDLKKRQRQHTWSGHTRQVMSVLCHPNGKTIVTRGGEDAVRIWDASSGQEHRTISFATELPTSEYFASSFPVAQFLALAPDGKALAASDMITRVVHLWDFATGRILFDLKGHTGRPGSLSFSPGGAILASADTEGVILLWERKTGQQLRRLDFQGNAHPNLA